MRSKSKVWLGVGVFVVAGTGAISAGVLSADAPVAGVREPGFATDTAIARAVGIMVAEHADHPKEGEGGEAAAIANLPPDLAFGVRIALLRGHLLVGDELVKQQQWNAALPHFLHPTEEIYGDIKGQLVEYKVPPFDAALKALADVVKGKKGGADYAKARKPVDDALSAAEAGMKGKQADWPGFVTESAIEAAKTAANEYEGAIVNGRIAKNRWSTRTPWIHLAGRPDDRERSLQTAKERRGCPQAGAGGIGLDEKGGSGGCRREHRSRIMLPCLRSWRASNLPPAS